MLMNNFGFSEINDLATLFTTVCYFKQSIVKLQLKELTNFKHSFYRLNFPCWQLNLLWELIWEDRCIDEVESIFINKKLLKEGDTVENFIRQTTKTNRS